MIFFDKTNFPFRLENYRFVMLVPDKNFIFIGSDGEMRISSNNMIELFYSDIRNVTFLLFSHKLKSHYPL